MNIRISQLPQAPTAITGSELVPIVQNGQTVQTTVGAIANSPTQQQTFLTTNQEPTLPNSRRIAGGLGIGVTDGGAQGQLSVALNAVSASLENASSGIIIKTSSNTIINRSIAVSGSGLAVTNANGLAGNPTLALSGLPSVLAGISGTGFLVTAGGTTMGTATIVGTASQITVVGGNGSSTPTISIADNAIIYGTGSITIPNGTTGQRTGSFGAVRYNTSLGTFEGFISTGWQQFALSGGVTSFQTSLSGLTPSSSTTGVVTLAGTLGISSGGTGQTTANLAFNALAPSQAGNSGRYLTTDGTDTSWAVNPLGTVTSVAAVASTGISVTGSPITTSGTLTITNTAPDQTVVLTAGTGISTSGTYPNFTITNTSPSSGGTVTSITAGTGLTGGTITTSGTIAIDSTVVTLTGSQTLTNKTLTNPIIGQINDVNSNEILLLTPVASATDYFTLKNGIGVGVPLHLVAEGSSTSIGLHIQPKGTGLVTISDGTDFNKGIRFRSSGSAASAITLLDAVSTAGRVVTLPDATTTLVGRDTTDTLTNKSISGSTNTLSNIGNASLTNSAITINGTSTSLGGSISVGTVTSVSGTGTVSGISLSGTVTTTGSLTLGGTLDLSSPPAIGATTPNTIKGTTITATTGIFGGGF